ncbi:MAG: flagellar basal body P-ring formation protein FlgA [Acidobacteriaceae bacterium]|nr:flagellar basal body P-ring formation protein FlgA [Acidobacteriaceae bacterium]
MLAILLAIIQPLACHFIKTDWIYGRDLAAAVPTLSAIAPDAQIGRSPLPGQQRVFRAGDLNRIALTNHISVEIVEDVCFAWELALPDRKQMQAAMAKSLANRNPSIEIVDSILPPTPAGEMVFPLSGLSMGSEQASIWRGYIRYAETRKLEVWTRVVVTVKENHVVAAADLRPGDSLRTEQLRLENYRGPVRRERYLIDPAQAAGMRLRCPLKAGAALTEDMLEAPQDINRGDLVNAIVQTGGARIEVQGVAESDGRKGQVISVRNPRSGRSFHARIEEKGTVVVVPGGQFGLVVETKKS